MRDRPDIEVNGKSRPPTLRDDLKELRNRFFHYGHDDPGDDALRAAMEAVADTRSSYVYRQNPMRSRARYADLAGVRLAHPFDLEFARDMHEQITKLIGPVSAYVQRVENAWLWTREPGIVTVTRPGGQRVPLRPPRRSP